MKATTVYIAGPMSGYADFNFPAFHAAAARLRDYGHTVVNPAEVCPELGKDWAYYMRMDLTAMLKCEAIYLLNSWQQSKGASLENYIAEALGMTLMYEANEMLPV